jgi:hypothetical protein
MSPCKLVRKHSFTAKLNSRQCGDKGPYWPKLHVSCHRAKEIGIEGRHGCSSVHALDINRLTCLDAGDQIALEQQWLTSNPAQQAGDWRLDLSLELAIETIVDMPDEIAGL